MRILHFIKGLGRGGAEILLVHALRYSDRDRFEYECAYMLPHKNALVAELEALGAPVHLVPGLSKAELLTASWRLSRLIREREIDLIHAHLPVAGIVARFAGALSRVPVVYTEHNLNEHYRCGSRWGNRVTWRMNDAVAAVSQPVAESIARTMPTRAQVPVRTILNGVDCDQFRDLPGGGETRTALGIDADAPVVINVAIFRRQKRLDLWLEAARKIHAALPEVQFILVGDGPMRAEVESWVQSKGLRDRVHLVGLQEDVKPYLAAADLFLLTSDFEGLPLAVIEAMAAGLPVVATRAGGLPGLVGEEGEVGGILLDKGDVPGCAEAVVGLLGDRPRLAMIGKTGRARVRRHFSAERMVHEYEDMYTAIATHEKSRGGRRRSAMTAL